MCPDWTRQVAAFDLGMHWLVCLCVEIDVHSYFDKNCWFRRDGVGPD